MPLLALHYPCRPSRTVVLAIRGSQSHEDLITDLMDRPVDIEDWVSDYLKQASCCAMLWPSLASNCSFDGPVSGH